MEKDETEKRKLFISQGTLNKDNSDNEIKVASSIYRIKNKENVDINNNSQNIDKISVKKKYNSEDNNTELNNEKNREIAKYKKSNSNHNSRQNSNDSKIKKNKNNQQNNRYDFFDNDELSEKYEEFSERNEPKEKPSRINYRQIKEYEEKPDDINDNDNLEQGFRVNEMKKAILRSSNNNIQFSYLHDRNPQSNEELEKNPKMKKNSDFSKYYLSSKKFVEKSKFFIVMFSIGIVLSAISLLFCIFLQLYGNQDVYIIFCAISLILIILYILAIKFTLQDRKKVLSIIKKDEDPERIFHSKSRKNLLLIIYFLLIAFNYNYVIMLVNTCFLNNIKLSIRGKGYDVNQWTELFSGKNYNEILKTFEKVNIAFLFFSWLNVILLIIIIISKIIFLFSYRLMKSIMQVLCILALQAGIFQIYLSIYCYKFRDAFEGIKLSWVTPGTMSNGCIAIIIGIFGFYSFYMEDKKKIVIFQIICFCQIILLMIFTGGLSAISDKFYNYKYATCNSLFKFISEDYLLKNKLNGCTSKYLFNSETLDGMQCPKDRIMINWEITEKLGSNYELNDSNININEIDSNREESDKMYFGCINQACCLQVYFDIKNKFDFLLILGIHLITFFIIILILGFYINYKLKTNFEVEEISEKKNFLFLGILTICIYIFVFPFIFSLPKSSNQSLLNKIENNEVSDSLSIIQNDLIRIDKDNLFKYTNESFNSVKQEIINNFKFNIVFDYMNKDDSEYSLNYYEYIITSSDLDIIVENTKLSQISYNDFKYNSFSNLTKKLIFKSKLNIINELFNYINFIPYNPLKNNILLNVEINGIFIKNKNNNGNQNNINNKYNNIIITKENLDKNYDENNNYSLISIIKKDLDFSIMNKDELFYLKGNIINDNGNSIINIYNYDYNNAPIYSIKSNNNGSFIIGPLYRLLNDKAIYYLNIEISKINSYKSEGKYIEDGSYCKYYDIIKISKFGFHFNKYYPLNNIFLPEYKEGSMDIVGNIIEYNENDEPISDVYVKLFYDNQINTVKEKIENNQESINVNFLDDICISKTITNKKGSFSFNINKSGQYMIVFIKSQYYLENHIFTIKDITSSEQFDIGTIQLISLFNSGKIIVKLEWENKPPDLDLICRFQVSKDHYCYTFFGNKKCVETEFFKDSRDLKEVSSEIIEISEFSEYVYLFYVRKYFDISNGYTRHEHRIEGVEIDPTINYTDISIKYNETLYNSIAKLLIYTNGYKIPALKISVPGYIENNNNKIETNQTEYNYWIAFCINGKEGINSLKVINELSQNEPPKNICLSYYDKSSLITF